MAGARTVFSVVWSIASDPGILFCTLIGTIVGLVFGAIPGLTATMATALIVPLTFRTPVNHAMGMLLGAYCGGIAGGAISSILLKIPGTPSSVVTCFDGYPMARKGQAAKALGWAAISSFVGGFISWLALTLVAPQTARFALRFGPPEYAMLVLVGLTIIGSVSGKSLTKGIVSGLVGLWLSLIGIDPIRGSLRYTFNQVPLMAGIGVMPALIGFFAIPEILNGAGASHETEIVKAKVTMREMFPTLRELLTHAVNLVRSSIIGIFIGMVPATGGAIASFLAYDQARRFSKHPEKFGEGIPDGVIASEAANNGVTGGALIPMLTLGIPGDSVTAVLLGGLIIHGLQPGPGLFKEHIDVVYGVFTTLLLANIFMTVIQFIGIRGFVKILSVPKHFLTPILLVLCFVGSYAINNSWFDVWVTLGLGLLGYLMTLAEFPMAPIVLGLVLGGRLETEIRRSLILSGGSWGIFVTRPISLALLLVSLAFVVVSHAGHRNRRRDHGGRAHGALRTWRGRRW